MYLPTAKRLQVFRGDLVDAASITFECFKERKQNTPLMRSEPSI